VRATARRLYHLYLVLGLVGLASVALAGGVAAFMVRPESPTASSIWRQCTQFLMALDPLAMTVLAVLSATGTILLFFVQSIVRQVRAAWRVRSHLTLLDAMELDGGMVNVVADERPEAFCMGYLNPRIYVSTGALQALSPSELEAVVVHERHHVARRDPLKLLFGRAAAEALFFLPPLPRLLRRYSDLAELAADEAAVAQAGRQPLASALLSFSEHKAPHTVVGIAPERVDHLGGAVPRWRFSRWWLAVWLFIGVGIFAAVVAGSLLAQGRSLSSLSLLTQACFVSMTGVPLLTGALLVLKGRRKVQARAAAGAERAADSAAGRNAPRS
jgi:Zn-dependent protease with chaperone function